MKTKLVFFLTLMLLQIIIWPGMAQAKYEEWDKYLNRYEKENKYLKNEGGLIVFLGDSITEFFPHDELRKRYNIINRGIRMDAVADALERLKVSVLDIKPSTLFIMLGTNDVCAYWLEPEEVVSRYQKLLQEIRTELPDTKIVVQSVLLTRDKNYNQYLRPINEGLLKVCLEMNIPFLDHNPGLAEGDRLGAKFTSDGIHLTATGYDLLVDNIRNYLASPVQARYQGKVIFCHTDEEDKQVVLVNLRSFVQVVGGSVRWWDGGEAMFTKGDKVLELATGYKRMLFNGEELPLNTPPVIIENSLYVPLIPLAECLGYSVTPSKDNKTLVLANLDAKTVNKAKK